MNIEKIKLLKKGELHVHLNGLVSSNIIKNIINEEKCSIPFDFNLNDDLTIAKPAKTLAEYLKPWQVLRLIPNNRHNLKIIVNNAFENLKSQNIRFAEIRNSIIYISKLNNISIHKALGWLISDIAECSIKYNIKAGLILTVSRGEFALEHLSLLLDAYEKLNKPPTIVGLDLAGNEELPYTKDLAASFKTAKQKYNLNITIHAGETGNFENINSAILHFDADRIGHGTAAPKSELTMTLLKERNICVEVCPISNRLTNAVPEHDAHPVIELIKHEIPFVICSDNPSIHQSTLSDDYHQFILETNSIKHIDNMFNTQRDFSFIKGL